MFHLRVIKKLAGSIQSAYREMKEKGFRLMITVALTGEQ